MGITKAAVLPLPVRALARISLPAKATGMTLACTGVGCVNLSCTIARDRRGSRSNEEKDLRSSLISFSGCAVKVLRRARNFKVIFLNLQSDDSSTNLNGATVYQYRKQAIQKMQGFDKHSVKIVNAKHLHITD